MKDAKQAGSSTTSGLRQKPVRAPLGVDVDDERGAKRQVEVEEKAAALRVCTVVHKFVVYPRLAHVTCSHTCSNVSMISQQREQREEGSGGDEGEEGTDEGEEGTDDDDFDKVVFRNFLSTEVCFLTPCGSTASDTQPCCDSRFICRTACANRAERSSGRRTQRCGVIAATTGAFAAAAVTGPSSPARRADPSKERYVYDRVGDGGSVLHLHVRPVTFSSRGTLSLILPCLLHSRVVRASRRWQSVTQTTTSSRWSRARGTTGCL